MLRASKISANNSSRLQKRRRLLLFSAFIIFLGFSGQAQAATKTITEDATGGDCSSVGTWDYPDKKCTLTTDLIDSIEIGSNGITLDGDGHAMTGVTDYGVRVEGKSGVTVKNFNVIGQHNVASVYLWNTHNSRLENISVSQSSIGIKLSESSGNTLSNNSIINGFDYGEGIVLADSHSNVLTDNTTSGNDKNWAFGIILLSSDYNTLKRNTVIKNGVPKGKGILISDSSNNALRYNILRRNDTAIELKYWSANNIIHYNDIIDNYCGGIWNAGYYPVDATYNWWGGVDGPEPMLDNDGDGLLEGNGFYGPGTYSPWSDGPFNLGDDDSLSKVFRPELHFKHDINSPGRNDYEPRTAQLLLDVPESKLVTQGAEIFTPDLDTLATNTARENYLDLPASPLDPFASPSYIDTYRNQLGDHPGSYPVTTYARVARNPENSTKTVVQYWLLYYYNNFFNNHEGDWEMVEVILDQDLEPEAVAYSQHGDSVARFWGEDGLEKNGTHPKVFVAEGSHANYPNNGYLGDHYVKWGAYDTTGDVTSATPDVSLLPSEGWLLYEGLWGEDFDFGLINPGPPGPKFQPPAPDRPDTEPWDHPLSWARYTKGDENDMILAAHSPVEIHIYDQQGNHIGKNAAGQVEKQIRASEYFERSLDHSKNIVVNDTDISGNYRLEIVGTGEGTMDLDVQVPEFAGNLVHKYKYLAVPISTTTKVKLEINPAKNFSLGIDQDGDGVYEEQRNPSTAEPTGVDFTPPSQVTDLSAGSLTSESAGLSWTAPGDDGNQGTAIGYELGYSTAPLTEESWDYAHMAGPLPDPQPAGTQQTVTVHGLEGGLSYYFAIRARDDAWQPGPISNLATGTPPDITAPALSGLSPAGWINTNSTTLRASYLDAGSGINTASVQVSLDGNPVSGCTVSSTAASCPVTGLSEGDHVFSASVSDNVGNIGSASGVFTVDLTAPTVSNLSPQGTINVFSTSISAALADAGAGVVPSSVVVTIDNGALSTCSISSTSVSCPAELLAEGNHSIWVGVSDGAGNSSSATGAFTVSTTIQETQKIDNFFTGGACPNIGSWHMLSRTCTLNRDITMPADTSAIEVALAGVTIEGAGHSLRGPTTDDFPSGAYVSYTEAEGAEIADFPSGVYVSYSEGQALETVKDINVYFFSSGVFSGASLLVTIENSTFRGNSSGVNLTAAQGSIQGSDFAGNGYGIYLLEASAINVYNNTFSGTSSSWGITVLGANAGAVYNNGFSGTGTGLYLSGANGTGVYGNDFAGNGIKLEASNGCNINQNSLSGKSGGGRDELLGSQAAVYLLGSSANIIRENTLSGNADGIDLEGSNANSIDHNQITGYSFYGLSLTASNGNSVYGNNLAGNALSDNLERYGEYDDGIYLGLLSSGNDIHGNSVSGNDTGVELADASENRVYHNNIGNNRFYGFQLTGLSYKNRVYNNNFSENGLAQMVANLSQVGGVDNDNRFNQDAPTGGNFYDSYSTPEQGCLNTNGDNFCDAPYAFVGGSDELPWVRRDGWLNP